MAAVGQRRRTPGSPQGRTSSVDPKRIRLEGRPAGRPSRRTYVPSTFTDQPGPTPLNAKPRPHRRIEAFPASAHLYTPPFESLSIASLRAMYGRGRCADPIACCDFDMRLLMSRLDGLEFGLLHRLG